MRYSVDVSVSFGSLDPKAREKLADLPTINSTISMESRKNNLSKFFVESAYCVVSAL